MGQYLGGQAMIGRMVGELAAAKRDLHEALGMFAQARDNMSISMTLTSFALVANDEGHHERAGLLVGAAAQIRDELGRHSTRARRPLGGSGGGRPPGPRRG